VGRAPLGGAVGYMGGASFCVRDLFILKEIWAQDKI
jgi:hypothetical protein